MEGTIKPTQAQLRLTEILTQLAPDDDDNLIATSNLLLRHFTFDAFGPPQWPIALHFPHVQIGTRNGQPVYVFPTFGYIATIPSDVTPNLQAVKNSQETLQNVDLSAPLRGVDEWKFETGGKLSRGFRALMLYILLLHAAETGSGGSLEASIDVADLKEALMKSAHGSKETHGEETNSRRHEPSVLRGPYATDRIVSNVTTPSEENEETDNPQSATGRGKQSSKVDGRRVYETAHGPTPEHDARPVDNVRTRVPRAPVKGVFTTSEPDTARPSKQQSVRNNEESSDEDIYFIASSRRNFRGRSKPTDDDAINRVASTAPVVNPSSGRESTILVSENGTLYLNDETDGESVMNSTSAQMADQNTGASLSAKDSPHAGMIQTGRKTAANPKNPEVTRGNDQQTRRRPVKNRNEMPGDSPAGIESAAALNGYFGLEALALIHRNTRFSFRLRKDWHPSIVPLGVCAGSTFQDADVSIVFHVILAADPATRPAMTWYAFDMKKLIEVK